MGGIGDISVADSRGESALVVEGFVGLGVLREFLEFLAVPGPCDVLLQPEARVFLGDDIGAGGAEFFVGAGLLGMPVGVEEGVDFGAAAGKGGDGFQYGVRTGGGSAINEQHSIAAHVDYYRGFAGDADDVEVVGEFGVALGGGLGK